MRTSPPFTSDASHFIPTASLIAAVTVGPVVSVTVNDPLVYSSAALSSNGCSGTPFGCTLHAGTASICCKMGSFIPAPDERRDEKGEDPSSANPPIIICSDGNFPRDVPYVSSSLDPGDWPTNGESGCSVGVWMSAVVSPLYGWVCTTAKLTL
jgi:hypothetical protein